MEATGSNKSFVDQSPNMTKIDPLEALPQEVSFNIFSYLELADLERSGMVNKQWRELAKDEPLRKIVEKKLPANAFGPKDWEKFGVFIDPKDVPPLPLNIHKMLKSQCPFSEKGKTMEETHVGPIFIPGEVNGKPLTIKKFGKIAHSRYPQFKGKRKDEKGKGYGFIWPDMRKFGGDGQSHWLMMTKEVVSETQGKKFAQQEQQITDKGNGNYEVTNALYAAVCAYSEYARTGEKTRILSKYKFAYARCKENKNGTHMAMTFPPNPGIVFDSPYGYAKDTGVAAQRKLV